MHIGFSDNDFINKFKELYPDLWLNINRQYDYWHKKNEFIISKGKKVDITFVSPIIFFWIVLFILFLHIEKNTNEVKAYHWSNK